MREKNTSTAEVDYVYPFDTKLIPIEVKSGQQGKLKSLHLFMNEASHNMAVRFYAGEINITPITIAENKTYFLLSLPYYLVSQIEPYLNWFKREMKKLIDCKIINLIIRIVAVKYIVSDETIY